MIDAGSDAGMTRTIGECGPAGEAARRSPISFSYCAQCGSWDAHDIMCVSCGYDFRPSVASVVEPDGY